MKERFQVATVRACRLARFSRAGFYRKSTAKDQSALRLRIREIAHARPRFGYQRIHVMLRREGWPVNKKRVRRLYRLDGLQIRTRIRRRKHMCLHRGPAPVPRAPHERWSMDFVHDQLFNGRPFRILTVVVVAAVASGGLDKGGITASPASSYPHPSSVTTSRSPASRMAAGANSVPPLGCPADIGAPTTRRTRGPLKPDSGFQRGKEAADPGHKPLGRPGSCRLSSCVT